MDRKYGFIKALVDQRDIVELDYLPISLPPSFDLREGCSPIEDQGALGSCSSHAVIGAVEYGLKRNNNFHFRMSRLFQYFNTRMIEGTIGYDSGATIRDAIKALVKYGCCPEPSWPYQVEDFAMRPVEDCYAVAVNFPIRHYASCPTAAGIPYRVADFTPVIFGISVYESFESEDAAKTGIIPMPERNERLIGGHAILAVSYDLAKRTIGFRNSWNGWGDDGYGTLSMDYVEKFGSDFWVVRL